MRSWITYTGQFTPEEDAVIQEFIKKHGLSRMAFIRKAVLRYMMEVVSCCGNAEPEEIIEYCREYGFTEEKLGMPVLDWWKKINPNDEEEWAPFWENDSAKPFEVFREERRRGRPAKKRRAGKPKDEGTDIKESLLSS
jgi:hypothetical protein